MKDSEMPSVADVTLMAFNQMRDGEYFHGNELHSLVARIAPEYSQIYTATILTSMRRKCRGRFRLVDRNDSLYQKIA